MSIQLTNIIEGGIAHWIDDLDYKQEAYYSIDVEVDRILDPVSEYSNRLEYQGEFEVLEVNAIIYDQHGEELGTEVWTLEDLLELHPDAEDLINTELEDY